MIDRLFGNSACRRGEHRFENEPEEVNTGYQLRPDGTRVEGRWARFRCERCGFAQERWEGPEVACGTTDGPRLGGTGAEPRSAERHSMWDHPATTWAVVLAVIALAAYAVYWDSLPRASSTSTAVRSPRR